MSRSENYFISGHIIDNWIDHVIQQIRNRNKNEKNKLIVAVIF